MGFARAKVAMIDILVVFLCCALQQFSAIQAVQRACCRKALLLGLSAVSAKAKQARSTQQWMRPKR